MIFRGAYNAITIPRFVHNYEQISDIPDLLLYFTASGLESNTTNSYGIVDDSNRVSTWYSQVTPQINGVQITSAIQPVLDIDTNGIKSLLFNGTTHFKFSTLFDLDFGTIIMVFKPTLNIQSGVTGQCLLSSDSASRPIQSGLFFGETSSAASNETIDITSWRNPWDNYYFCGSYSRTSISNSIINKLAIYADVGIEYLLNDSSIPVYDYLPGGYGYIRVYPYPDGYNGTLRYTSNLGVNTGLSNGYQGKLYEMMIFNRKLNTYEQTYINYVLNLRYGI